MHLFHKENSEGSSPFAATLLHVKHIGTHNWYVNLEMTSSSVRNGLMERENNKGWCNRPDVVQTTLGSIGHQKVTATRVLAR